MILIARPTRKSRRRGRRQTITRVLLVVVLLALAFVLGIAFGRALDEESGNVVTTVRTLEPLPLEEPPRTVTVTVTEP